MIDTIGGFLQRNLIVMLAVVLVPMKLAILRICGDEEAQRAAFLSIPEDLVYISMGIVLGDFATAGGAFRRWFANSSHLPMDLAVTVMCGLSVAIAVHVLSKWTTDHFRNWKAASNVRMKGAGFDPRQGELNLEPADMNIRMIQIRHISLGSLLYLAQFIVVIRWLDWIAKVIAHS